MLKWLKDKFNLNKDEVEDNIEEIVENQEIENIEEDVSTESEIKNENNYNVSWDNIDKDEESNIIVEEKENDVIDEKVSFEKTDEIITEEEVIEEEVIEEKVIEEKVIEEENAIDVNALEENIEAVDLEEVQEVEEVPVKKVGFFQKLVDGLTKTRDQMTEKIDDVLASYHKIDEELFDDLEEALVMADVGVETTMEITDRLKTRVQKERITNPNDVKQIIKEVVKELMNESVESNDLNLDPSPALLLVVGVNGVGKTTTIGKLSNTLKNDGKKVLMAAGDTFRAAAIEQLEEWSNRSGVEIISHTEGADPGAVIFDAIHAAKARKTDVLICDTAGRLHNKANLMNELGKIFKIVEREYPEATKEVLLVLDATTGQNAINQAKTFKEVADITGVALTKLDGTAKGGVIIALQAELGLPVKLVGVGEGIDDLQPFNTDDFVEALFK